MSLLSREFQRQEVPGLKTFLTDQVSYDPQLLCPVHETYVYSSKGIRFTVLNVMGVSIALNDKTTF
jgi:hypothetical protein